MTLASNPEYHNGSRSPTLSKAEPGASSLREYAERFTELEPFGPGGWYQAKCTFCTDEGTNLVIFPSKGEVVLPRFDGQLSIKPRRHLLV